MVKSIAVKHKRPGRPATGHDPFVGIRLPEALLKEIAEWSDKHEAASRSEAIRRLVELGLTVKARPKQAPDARAERAKELAAKVIEKLTSDADTEEKVNRRRRLLKGPEEFRDVRVDRMKK